MDLFFFFFLLHQNIYVYAPPTPSPPTPAATLLNSLFWHISTPTPACCQAFFVLCVCVFCIYLSIYLIFFIGPPPLLPGGFRGCISCCCLFHTWATFVFSFSIPCTDTDPYINSHTRAPALLNLLKAPPHRVLSSWFHYFLLCFAVLCCHVRLTVAPTGGEKKKKKHLQRRCIFPS